ncbi:MAG: PAS domain-containing protein, partial [Actinomycetota bacterium]|nr:PAS domain-containing protein [Actinomycetota bacterium]
MTETVDAEERDPSGMEELLMFLRDARGFDFTGYKRTTLRRRISRRMQLAGVTDFADYRDLLEADPGEVTDLFNTILINVTGFFRDRDVWDEFATKVVPELLAQATPERPVRVWSAGCAAGQEPYSIAMLFAEALGGESPRDLVKIYATDIDEDALATARRARYTAREVEDVPPELLERYFDVDSRDDPTTYSFSPELRRSVIFGRHNLISDAPISRVDLLMCRNTLMYFNAPLQREVVRRLHFSLAPDGILVLGKVEMLLGHRSVFEVAESPVRIFRRLQTAPGESLALLALDGTAPAPGSSSLPSLAFAAGMVAQVVVDDEDQLVLANDAARERFHLSDDDVGRPLRDLELSYRPVELRSRLESATSGGQQEAIKDVRTVDAHGVVSYLDVLITPLRPQAGAAPIGAVVSFVDVSHHHELQTQIEAAHRDLEAAYGELQSTNEELETTNEELQSTIEELETTNEELRSTNEEFETMNDELQSVNDELALRNRALQERSAELVEARGYFRSVLDSVGVGLVAVDADLRVLSWNAGAENLWGARADEAEGRTLLSLDIGLPLEQLAAPI